MKVNKKNVMIALEVIAACKTQPEAYEKLESKGITGGLNHEVWFAFNNLPKKSD